MIVLRTGFVHNWFDLIFSPFLAYSDALYSRSVARHANAVLEGGAVPGSGGAVAVF